MTSASEGPQALFLGTGTSTGVPLIGCSCAVCASSDTRNNRLRSSLYLTHAGFGLLIDTTPDFRQQALRSGIPRIDAVLVTHGHADHVFGMDDLRRFNTLQRARIPVYASPSTVGVLSRVFDYFLAPGFEGTYLPQVDFVTMEGPLRIGPFEVTPFDVEHGRDRTWGFRIDTGAHSLAYAPDCFRFPDAARAVVRGVGTMVLDALRHTPHVSHMTVAESVQTLRQISAAQSFLTHLGHDLDYAKLVAHLPAGILPAYDGLRIDW